MYGELIPLGGGDPIPLPDPRRSGNSLVGRRESCDIVLRFANVSAHHCQLICDGGYWYVTRPAKSQRHQGQRRARSKRQAASSIRATSWRSPSTSTASDYDPVDLGAVGPPPADNVSQEMQSESLLARAGLESSRDLSVAVADRKRYDVTRHASAGQVKLPDDPV